MPILPTLYSYGENSVLVLETVMEDRHLAGITEYLVTTRCAAQKLMLPS